MSTVNASVMEKTTMSESFVRCSQSGGVRTLTMIRASTGNLLDAAMYEALNSALDNAISDRSVRCLLLNSSAGSFSIGHGRTRYARMTEPAIAQIGDPTDLMDKFHIPLLRRIRSLPVPIVAAVNGAAAGAGVTLALSCDFVIAARSSRFVEPFAKTGAIRDIESARLLQSLMGRTRALGWTLLGSDLSALDALRFGLIWDVTANPSLYSESHSLAQRLTDMPGGVAIAARNAIDGISTPT
jgi:2-(1,2-epoxy-1,2-dihydrophenyl)acetyl-CoA isomerase